MEHSKIFNRKKDWTKDIGNRSRTQVKSSKDEGQSKKRLNKETTGESSESEADIKQDNTFHRKISTKKEIKDAVSQINHSFLPKFCIRNFDLTKIFTTFSY